MRLTCNTLCMSVDVTPDLSTLSGRIAFEISLAGERAMRRLYPDLPELNWTRCDDGTLVACARECHAADGTLARWVERLGLVDGREEWDRPGYSRFVGAVDGIPVEIGGITDRAAWNLSRKDTR